jgi:selenide,water dikinase
MTEDIKLTSFSHGGGCGCKIAPNVLEEILYTQHAFAGNKNLIVGNNSKDDAAVYDLGNGTAVISTTDFFMPIVNDAFDFGRIASANAISDVYAMGGKPIMAIAVLGWPVDKIPASVAQRVLEGSRSMCAEAGIPLAGGHSIDSPEPIFGLAVTGMVDLKNMKQNNTAKEGDVLFITKKLGVGIVSTAQKKGLLEEEHLVSLMKQLTQLNSIGEKLSSIGSVHAMTDVTGFGLLGHLLEMTEGSGLSSEIFFNRIPVLEGAKEYMAQKVIPGATKRNWNSVNSKVVFEGDFDVEEATTLLADPQTNGGLLLSVSAEAVEEVQYLLTKEGYADFIKPIGKMLCANEKVISVKYS